jgi:hypothetical protein
VMNRKQNVLSNLSEIETHEFKEEKVTFSGSKVNVYTYTGSTYLSHKTGISSVSKMLRNDKTFQLCSS